MRNSFIISFLFLLLLFSCEKEDSSNVVKNTTLGESFTIELKANWSAGYQWSWTNRDKISVVDTTDLQYIVDNPDLEGSPGTEIWTFKANAAGKETLTFTYGRSGEETEDTRQVEVTVNDQS